MLGFHRLQKLLPHKNYLAPLLHNQDVFFVGGAIRDLLAGSIEEPLDVDVTLAADPDAIRKNLPDHASFSRFRTEKFGTITLLPKGHFSGPVSYEITPFRKEGGYADFRHPDQIGRSESLLEDSNRRDFTINCLYVGFVTLKHTEKTEHDATRIANTSELQETLMSTSVIFFSDHNVLLVQDHSIIEEIIVKGIIDAKGVAALLESSMHVYLPGLPNSPSSQKEIILLLDPHHGLQDLIDKKIRTVGDPHRRFSEDALRILRGVRFVNILNQQLPYEGKQNALYDFEGATRDAMKKNYYLVSYLAKERIHQELIKVFSYNNPFGYIALLDELHVTSFLFPSLERTKNIAQPLRYHAFDVYTHTILTLFELQKINTDPLVKLAMLYHDVGKTDQYYYYSQSISKDEKKLPLSGYMYHTVIGIELAQRDLEALGCSKKEIEEICRYIKHHHRPGELLNGKEENMVKKLRKMISDVDVQRVENLIDIAIADRRGQYNPIQPPAVEQLLEMKEILQSLYQEEGRFTMKQLAITGEDIIAAFHLKPGPQIGIYLDNAFQRVLDNIAERNAKDVILEYLTTQ